MINISAIIKDINTFENKHEQEKSDIKEQKILNILELREPVALDCFFFCLKYTNNK